MSGAQQQASGAQLEVLWIGDDARAGAALARLGMRVRRARRDQWLQLVASRAPDVLVLSGSAAAQAEAIVCELRTRQPGATLPVVVISSDSPPARGHGGLVAHVSAALARNALASLIQERVAAAAALSRLRELTIAQQGLDAWLRTALEEESAGFLLTGAGAIAIGPGGQLAPSPEQVLHALARDADAPAVKVLELPANRLLVLNQPPAAAAAADLSGAQIVVVHPDPERGTELCGELVGAGAAAQSFGVEPADTARVAAVAPALIVIAAAALRHPSTASLWQDARLASAAWLVLDESQDAPLSPPQLLAPAARLIAAGRPVRERLAKRELVVDRIESFGAAGWLREVGRWEPQLTLVLKSASGRSEVSLVGGKIRGASFVSADGGPPQQGQAALQASLAMSFGRVLVGPHDAVVAHEASLHAGDDFISEDAGEEPAASEIRERRPDPQLPAPSATPPRSFRPSKPGQSGVKTKAPAATASVLPLRVTGTTSAPAANAAQPPAESAASATQPVPPGAEPEQPAANAARPARPPRRHRTREEPAATAAPPPRTPQAGEQREEPTRAPQPALARAEHEEPTRAPQPALTPQARAEHEEPATLRPPPASQPPAQREEPVNAPQPGPPAQPRAEREEHTPPPLPSAPVPPPGLRPEQRARDAGTSPQEPQRAAFDVALARGVASAPGVRSRPPLPLEPAEPSPAAASASPLRTALAGSPAQRASAPPPLPRRREILDPFAPLSPELFGAPIAPIASELEPTPSPPLLPAQPEPQPSRPPRSSRAIVFGAAAAALGFALLANTLTGFGGSTSLRPSPPERAEIATSSPAPLAQSAAPNALAQTTPGALTSARAADRRAAAQAAPDELRPTPIPRGSEAAELLQQAKQARDDSHPKQAEALLSEVLARYPNDFGARYHMALTLVRMRRFEEAHAQLSKALQLNGESASGWLLEGDIFLQEGRRQNALRAWNRCLAAQADFPSCKERLARWRWR